MIKNSLLLLLLLTGLFSAKAQVTISLAGAQQPSPGEFILRVVKGTSTPLVFSQTGGTAGAVEEWTLTPNGCNNAPCPDITPVPGSPNQFTVTTNKSYIAEYNVHVAVGNPQDAGFKEGDATLQLIVNNVIDYAFVLDKSGSMGTMLTKANMSRWAALTIGVGLMTSKLNYFGSNVDNAGLRFFDTHSSTPADPSGLIPLNDLNVSKITSVVNASGPGGNTALGEGMKAGSDLLLNPPAVKGHTKVMFVFSDGEQNSGQYVDPTGRFLIPSNVKLRGNYPTTDSIYTYAIGYGSVGSYKDLMAAIGDNDPNRFLIVDNNTQDVSGGIANSLDAMVNKILATSSPQFVGIRNSDYAISGSNYTFKEEFVVNKKVRKVFISMVSQPANGDSVLVLTANGKNILPYAKKTYGNGYRTFTIDFPIPGQDSLQPQGTWVIAGGIFVPPVIGVRGNDGQNVKPRYYISFTVDDHTVHMDYSLGGKSFLVGQTVRPSVKISKNGTVITNATVKAGIFAPGVDIGDFIARAGGAYTAPPTGDPGSPGLNKLEELLKDTAIAAKLKSVENEINLTFDPATGRYSGDFNQLKVSGVYQVLYSIEAEDSTLGSIRRFEQASIIVSHGDIDMSNSAVSIVPNNSGQTVLTFRPISNDGYFWGPGYAGSIVIDYPGAKVDSIIDKGDGTYVAYINGKLSGSGTITINGINAIKGDAAKLDCYTNNVSFWAKIKCWLMSLGLPAWAIWVVLLVLLILLWLIFKKKK
ncbi:vWA domain-containing protein [Chitinophaga silvatica]|nr:vWA domain-containing protein [Chitinophaga silvatica]